MQKRIITGVILAFFFAGMLIPLLAPAGEKTLDSFDNGHVQASPYGGELSADLCEKVIDMDMKFRPFENYKIYSRSPRRANAWYEFRAFLDLSWNIPFKLYFDSLGSVQVFNVSSYYDLTYWNTTTISLTGFSIDGADFNPSYSWFLVAGKDSANSIKIHSYSLNYTTTTPSLTLLDVETIYNPVNATVLSIDIRALDNGGGTYFTLYGRYNCFNGSYYSMPFLYNLNTWNNASIFSIDDCLGVNSTNYWRYFDDCVMKAYPVSFNQSYFLFSNKGFYLFDLYPFITRVNLSLPREIPLGTPYNYHFAREFRIPPHSLNDHMVFLYSNPNPFPGDNWIVKMNYSAWIYPDYTNLNPTIEQATYGIFPEFTDYQGIIMTSSDFGAGLLIFQQDMWGNIWSTNDLDTGDQSPYIFDFFWPVSFRQVYAASYSTYELIFVDSRGIWVAHLDNNIGRFYSIGTGVDFTKIQISKVQISHATGTNTFDFTIYGAIYRNNSDIVQFGILPQLMIPSGIVGGQARIMTTTDSFTMAESEATILPGSQFQGYMQTYAEFVVTCKSQACPNYIPFDPTLDVLACNFDFVCFEVFSNGTITQSYLDKISLSTIADFTYSLETTLMIEDSHLLDELHVFSGGVEYSPYSFFINNPVQRILVTDKFTGSILLNTSVRFSDPLRLPISSKYEFWTQFYSNVDLFGIDFAWFKVFINSTQITTPQARVLSPSAELVVKDFSDSVIANVTINKVDNGSYIYLGLNVHEVILKNNYNFTCKIVLFRAGKSIQYTLPGGVSIPIRLAFGDYSYEVYDLDDNLLIEEDVTFALNENPGISFGFTSVTPENVYLTSIFDYLLTLILFGAIIGIFIFVAFRLRAKNGRGQGQKPVKREKISLRLIR